MPASVYKVIEIIGTSTKSWEDAAQMAIETASKSLKDLRIAEVVEMDMQIEDGKIIAYRTRLHVSFKYLGKEMV
jgi:dodecin